MRLPPPPLMLMLLLLGAVRAPEPACDFAVVDDPALLQRHQQTTLLRGGAEHWPALREWRGFPAFVARHPNLSLPRRHNMQGIRDVRSDAAVA